jgi:hypothetical protein
MNGAEIPLQIDLFTGQLVDNRTADQKRRDIETQIPTQLLMFSQRDIAQIGVSPTPRMDLSPGRLMLIAEDPRSEEEKERDRLQAAQDQTIHLFSDEASPRPTSTMPDFTPPEMEIPQPSDEGEADDEPEEIALPAEPPLSKLLAYQALTAAVAEATRTLESSEPIRLAQEISVSLATHNAKRAGLTEAEMTAARTIGSFRASPQEPIAPPVPQASNDVTKPSPTVASHPSESGAGDDIPIVWVKRSDFVKRRPDLATEIAHLKDDEVAFLAERVGDALEEFYWIQLNVVLSLFLDHQLALHLDVSKPPKKTQKKRKRHE